MSKCISLFLISILFSISAFSRELGPACPSAKIVKDLFISEHEYYEEFDFSVAKSLPYYGSNGLLWQMWILPFEENSPDKIIRLAQKIQKDIGESMTQHAQTSANSPVWACLYESEKKLVILGTLKPGNSFLMHANQLIDQASN